MALMQVGGESWEKWNPKIREYLLKLQSKTGRDKGAWPQRPQHGHQGGLIYTTTMATLTLEVYYRYLPIYKHQRTGKAPK